MRRRRSLLDGPLSFSHDAKSTRTARLEAILELTSKANEEGVQDVAQIAPRGRGRCCWGCKAASKPAFTECPRYQAIANEFVR